MRVAFSRSRSVGKTGGWPRSDGGASGLPRMGALIHPLHPLHCLLGGTVSSPTPQMEAPLLSTAGENTQHSWFMGGNVCLGSHFRGLHPRTADSRLKRKAACLVAATEQCRGEPRGRGRGQKAPRSCPMTQPDTPTVCLTPNQLSG